MSGLAYGPVASLAIWATCRVKKMRKDNTSQFQASIQTAQSLQRSGPNLRTAFQLPEAIQGYLAHKKPPPPRTPQQDYA